MPGTAGIFNHKMDFWTFPLLFLNSVCYIMWGGRVKQTEKYLVKTEVEMQSSFNVWSIA